MPRKRKIQYVEESDDADDEEEEVDDEEEPVRKRINNGIPSAPNPVVNVPQVSTFEGNEIQVSKVLQWFLYNS